MNATTTDHRLARLRKTDRTGFSDIVHTLRSDLLKPTLCGTSTNAYDRYVASDAMPSGSRLCQKCQTAITALLAENTTTTKENDMTDPTCNVCSTTGTGAVFPMLPKSEGFSFGTICVECDTGSNTTYEGWVNRPTWLGHLWLSNDQRLNTQALKRTAREMDKGSSPTRIGQLLTADIMSEMQRLLGRGEPAMYDDFVKPDEKLIPQIDCKALGESFIATVLDYRSHGEVI